MSEREQERGKGGVSERTEAGGRRGREAASLSVSVGGVTAVSVLQP